MDNRPLRSRKGKSRNARPYDRQNQSIFDKVCSTVKGLLNPGWLPNISQWIGNPENQQQRNSPEDVEEDNENINNDVVSRSVSNANKRLRLRVDGHNFQDGPSFQSSETQTWPEQPSQNLYETISHVVTPPSASQNSLLENKEVMTVMNGDDHSENSEGSASTSGCSSLISSHKERLAERPFASLLDAKIHHKRREMSPKTQYNDVNSSRGLWSSNFSPLKFQKPYPTVSQTNQPNFNLSSFTGPSRLSERSDKRTSSPFYGGKTTFGGASALRRMPASVVPYQVDRNLRNQVKVREQNSEDNLKRMSSAAERILLTLDKISSPVSDAKRIPNLDTSPVDLSIYLTPPKSRWNSQLTPSIVSKGPPIANINTIAKLATLKNYGTSRLRSTPQGSVTSFEQKTSSFDNLQSKVPEIISQKSAGGKMKNKLNQHHISSKQADVNDGVMDTPILKSIPLPITSLPTINFGSKPDKTGNSPLSASGFTFSKPIEHDLSISCSVPTSTLVSHSPYDSFKFSNPIDYDLPTSSQPKENLPSPTWECSTCWVRNPQSKISCVACETPRETKEVKSTANQVPSSETQDNHVSSFKPATSNFTFGSAKDTSNSVSHFISNKYETSAGFTFGTKKDSSNLVAQKQIDPAAIASIFGNNSKSHLSSTIPTTSIANNANCAETWECKECWVKNPVKESKCLACETPQSKNNTEIAAVTTSINAFSTWECTSCWVRNPMKEKKCMACETLHPNIDMNSGTKDSSAFKFSSPLQNSPITFKFGNYVCTAPSTITTSTFKFGVSATEAPTTTSTSGFKFDTPTTNTSIIKTSEATPNTTQSSVTTGFKMPNVTLSVESSQSENVSNKYEVSQTKNIFPVVSETADSVSQCKNNDNKISIENSVIKTKESALEPKKNNSTISSLLHSDESSKAKLLNTITPSTSSNVPSPSVTACFGFTSKPIELKTTKENKVSEFKATSELVKLSEISSPANLFKFGEKLDTSKNNVSSTSGTLTTTTTIPNFSFSNSSSSFGSVTNSKNKEIISSTSYSNPVTVKTEENKIDKPTVNSSVTTSSTFVFGSSVNTSVPSAFSFFPSSSASSVAATTASTTANPIFTFGASSNQSGGFTFKGLEKPQTTSAVSSTTQTTASVLNSDAISTQVPSFQHPVFGMSKSEAPTTHSVTPITFTFGSGTTTVSSNSSAFSAFQPSQSSQTGNPSFQFGSQLPGTTASIPSIGTSTNVFSKNEASNSTSQNTVPVFGSTATNLVFGGAKSENPIQISNAVSQPPSIAFGTSANFTFSSKTNSDTASQKPVIPFGSDTASQKPVVPFGSDTASQKPVVPFGSDTASQKPVVSFGSSTMPVFGNNPVQNSFDGADKTVSGGFNFGASTVFQFGATSNNDKKRTATVSGFSFATPAASETNTSPFPTGFTINTPPSFNFGATSTPTGAFQFAASNAAKPASTSNSGPRKIRKAVRRVRGKD